MAVSGCPIKNSLLLNSEITTKRVDLIDHTLGMDAHLQLLQAREEQRVKKAAIQDSWPQLHYWTSSRSPTDKRPVEREQWFIHSESMKPLTTIAAAVVLEIGRASCRERV